MIASLIHVIFCTDWRTWCVFQLELSSCSKRCCFLLLINPVHPWKGGPQAKEAFEEEADHFLKMLKHNFLIGKQFAQLWMSLPGMVNDWFQEMSEICSWAPSVKSAALSGARMAFGIVFSGLSLGFLAGCYFQKTPGEPSCHKIRVLCPSPLRFCEAPVWDALSFWGDISQPDQSHWWEVVILILRGLFPTGKWLMTGELSQEGSDWIWYARITVLYVSPPPLIKAIRDTSLASMGNWIRLRISPDPTPVLCSVQLSFLSVFTSFRYL